MSDLASDGDDIVDPVMLEPQPAPEYVPAFDDTRDSDGVPW